VKTEYLEIFGTEDTKKDLEEDLDTITLDKGDLLETIKYMTSQIEEYNGNIKKIYEIKSYFKNLPEELKKTYKEKKVYKDFKSQCEKIDDKSCNLAIFNNIDQYGIFITDINAKKRLANFIYAELKKHNDQQEVINKIKDARRRKRRTSISSLKIPPPTFNKGGGKTVKRRNRKTKRQQKRRKSKSKAKNK